MFRMLSIAVLAFGSSVSYAASTTLNGTVRDFASDGVNFEGALIGLVPGLVESALVGASPTLTALGEANIEPTNFGLWFTKSTDTLTLELTLDETFAGSGIYEFSSSSFFPIDGALLGNEGNSHNYHFTYSLAAEFGYKPGTGQTFSFTGDDDVWVFFDKRLGIDLGGVHGASSASVDMDALLAGSPEGNYSFDLFFAERHLSASNLKVSTSLVLVPVPEPSSYALMIAGLAGICVIARRRCAG